MQNNSLTKSELARMAPQPNLIWKKNDLKAQKNGPHSNIYWVKVPSHSHRNNPSTKTAQSNPTSGAAPTNTSATGRTIKRKASASSTTPTGISTKEDGTKINATAKEPTGWQTPRINSGDSTRGTGKMTQSKEEARCSTRVGIDMTACGWTTFPTAREE